MEFSKIFSFAGSDYNVTILVEDENIFFKMCDIKGILGITTVEPLFGQKDYKRPSFVHMSMLNGSVQETAFLDSFDINEMSHPENENVENVPAINKALMSWISRSHKILTNTNMLS